MREGHNVGAEREGVESRVIDVVRSEKADKGSDEGPGAECASREGGDERGVWDGGGGCGGEGLGTRGVDVVDAAGIIKSRKRLERVADCDYGGLLDIG
jgi:hypothetical protein